MSNTTPNSRLSTSAANTILNKAFQRRWDTWSGATHYDAARYGMGFTGTREVYLALGTSIPDSTNPDAFTEVSGSGYERVLISCYYPIVSAPSTSSLSSQEEYNKWERNNAYIAFDSTNRYYYNQKDIHFPKVPHNAGTDPWGQIKSVALYVGESGTDLIWQGELDTYKTPQADEIVTIRHKDASGNNGEIKIYFDNWKDAAYNGQSIAPGVGQWWIAALLNLQTQGTAPTAHNILYLGLHTDDPGSTGGVNEFTSSSSTGYYRAYVPLELSTATTAMPKKRLLQDVSGESGDVYFHRALSNWGTATYLSIWSHTTFPDELTGAPSDSGQFLWGGHIKDTSGNDTSITVETDDIAMVEVDPNDAGTTCGLIISIDVDPTVTTSSSSSST